MHLARRPEAAPAPVSSSLPGVGRREAFLETQQLLDDATGVLLRHAERFGGAYTYYLGGVKKVLVATSTEVFQRVLKDNPENYLKSDIQVRRMAQFLGQGLLTGHGPPWRRKRRVVQQGFAPEQLVSITGDMQAALEAALPGFAAAAADGPVELCAQFTRITFGMVTRSLFSTALDDGEVARISEGIGTVQAFMVRQIIEPHLRPWFVLSGALRRHQRIRRQGDAILLRMIDARRADPAPPVDLLQILLEAPFAEDGGPLSDAQLLAECMQILVAGHETSSHALAWTLFLLARHPQHLAVVRAELGAAGSIAPGTIAALPATSAAIQEALRLFPPFWMIDRLALADDRAGAVAIPRGSTVIVFIHGAHHAAAYWPDAESFQPERFMGEGRAQHHGLHHLPFGAGPRRCIGANYAMMQMAMVLQAILGQYRITLEETPPVLARPMIIQRPRDGIWMRFERTG